MDNCVKTEKTWLNIAKCISILLVIHWHTYSTTVNIIRWYLSFQMPIFYFISGYLFNNKYSCKEFLQKRIKRLVIPYYLSIPIAILSLYAEDVLLEEIKSIKEYCKITVFDYLLLYKPTTEQWFIINLFIVEVVGFFLIKYIKRNECKLLVTSIMLIIGICLNSYSDSIYPFHIEKLFMMLPFYVMGYFYQQYEEKIKGNLNIKCVLYFIGTLCVWFVITLTQTGFAVVLYNSYGNYLLFYIGAIIGIGFIITVSKVINKNSLMEKIGKESLLLCLTHRFLVVLLNGTIVRIVPNMNTVIKNLVALITMAIVIALILSWKKEYIVLKQKLYSIYK